MAERPVQIEPASSWRLSQTLRFIAAGDRGDIDACWQADALAQAMRHPTARRAHIWWARRGRRTVAAAMTIVNPGRAAILYHSPPHASGVEVPALIEVIRQVSQETLLGGAAFVQALLAPEEAAPAALLQQAGFVRLAELAFMLRPIQASDAQAPPDADRFRFLEYGQYTLDELGRLIQETYRDSQDCPLLSGLRQPSDVIESHQSTGVFSPRTWWVVSCGQTAAGCILVNLSSDGDECEVVYLGVAPAFRRQGLGRMMLRRAYCQAAIDGLKKISLAVDSANKPAVKLYEQESFRATQRRIAYISYRHAGGET